MKLLCRLGLHDWKHTRTGWIQWFTFVARYECQRPGCDALHLCDRYHQTPIGWQPVPHGPFHPDARVPVRDFEEERRAAEEERREARMGAIITDRRKEVRG